MSEVIFSLNFINLQSNQPSLAASVVDKGLNSFLIFCGKTYTSAPIRKSAFWNFGFQYISYLPVTFAFLAKFGNSILVGVELR